MGHVHNVNNGALCAADLTFAFCLRTPTSHVIVNHIETGSKQKIKNLSVFL